MTFNTRTSIDLKTCLSNSPLSRLISEISISSSGIASTSGFMTTGGGVSLRKYAIQNTHSLASSTVKKSSETKLYRCHTSFIWVFTSLSKPDFGHFYLKNSKRSPKMTKFLGNLDSSQEHGGSMLRPRSSVACHHHLNQFCHSNHCKRRVDRWSRILSNLYSQVCQTYCYGTNK